jgi:tellurite resistance protein TerC
MKSDSSMTTNTLSIGEPWMWIAFIVFVLVMLALDLFVFGGKKAHKVSVKEAAIWSLVWISLALIFNALLWWYMKGTAGDEVAGEKAMEFLTGYVIEKSLSVDNVFVFLMLFTAFQVPAEYQRRVLLYGVLGAIVMRAIMIMAGSWVVREYSWVLYIFGFFLVVTGIRMMFMAEHVPQLEKNWVLRFSRKYLRVTDTFRNEKFVVRENGLLYVTPLFLVLIMVEFTDLIFAVDSIPAIFAITTDPFIVFTSNIFAILGLRALYFLLADMAERFKYLKYGLAVVLTFVGGKMLMANWHHLPIQYSLLFIVSILAASVAVSLWSTRKQTV